jgi:hypothetical protein
LINKLEASNACLEQQVESLKEDLMEATDLQSVSAMNQTKREPSTDSSDTTTSESDSVVTVREKVHLSILNVPHFDDPRKSTNHGRWSPEKRSLSQSAKQNQDASAKSPNKKTKVSVKIKVKNLDNNDETIDSTFVTDETLLLGHHHNSLHLDIPGIEDKKDVETHETQTSFLLSPKWVL